MTRGVAMSELGLGKRLRILRGDRTLAEVASDLEMAKTTLHGYETERREPDLKTLQKIARYYGTSMAYLVGETDDPRPPTKVEAAAPNREAGVKDGDPLPPDLQLYIEKAIFRALDKWERKKDAQEGEEDE